MFGLSPYLIRMLCENTWNGGYGYTPSQVGDMTLDQVFMLLADKKILRRSGKARQTNYAAVQVAAMAGADGLIKGRAADGTAIKAKIRGQSLASRLAEEERKRAEESKSKQSKTKRRKSRKNRTD